MAKKKKEIDLESLISTIEETLQTEIENLPTILQEVHPEKRIDFITKTLSVVVKYRETHSLDGGW